MKNIRNIIIISLLLVGFACGSEEEPKDETSENSNTETISENTEQDSNTPETTENIGETNAEFEAFLSNFDKAKLPYKQSLSEKENSESKLVSQEIAIKYLTAAEDYTTADMLDAFEYTDYYFVSIPIRTAKFVAVVYIRYEMTSNYYVLATYNNQGEYIASVDFANYQLIGAGPEAGHEYFTNGEISASMEVSIIYEETSEKFQISETGEITQK